jgi:NADH:ubiquinone oxidoreductase subunit E
MSVELTKTQDVSTVVEAAIARHGQDREALVPVLSEVNERLGYLSTETLAEISRKLRVPGAQLLSVASFYHMLSTKPRGRHVIKFCESAPCHVMGGRLVWQALQETLQIEPGETSADGKWTLLTTSCPGVCGVGPVMMIDDDVYGNLTPNRLPEILGQYE